MKVKQTKLEIIKGKFVNTIAAIESVYREAESAVSTGQNYSPEAVLSRNESISKAFYGELTKLSKDIED